MPPNSPLSRPSCRATPTQAVWVTRDGNDLLVSTVMGRRKHLNVEADPRCSVIVYPKDNPYSYVSSSRVEVEASARELIVIVRSTPVTIGTPPTWHGQCAILRIHPEKVVTLIR